MPHAALHHLSPTPHATTCFQTKPAVPCLSRAADLERYDPQSEFALGGDEDGWTATHRDPQADAAAEGGTKGRAEDNIPSLDDEEEETAGAGAGERPPSAKCGSEDLGVCAQQGGFGDRKLVLGLAYEQG